MPHIAQRPHAFLFDAHLSRLVSIYGSTIDTAFFSSVLDADKEGRAAFRLKRGSLLLDAICYRTAEVEYTSALRRTSVSETRKFDSRLFSALLFDLCDSASHLWFSLDQQGLPLTLATKDTYVLFVSDAGPGLRDSVDSRLREYPFYIGALEVDLANPLQEFLFRRLLPYRYYYTHQSLGLPLEWYSDPDDRFDLKSGGHWWSDLPFRDVFWHDERTPPLSEPLDFLVGPRHDRAVQSAELLARVTTPYHGERIARALLEKNYDFDDYTKKWFPFCVDFSEFQEVVIPPKKLTDYCLNPDHPKGRSKAELFCKLLDINKEDWRYLALQIVEGLRTGKVHMVRSTEYGIQYHVDIMVVGLNGSVKPVRTAWLTKSGQPPRLITAFIPEPSDQSTMPPVIRPRVIHGRQQKADYWREIYDDAHAAGVKAASSSIPIATLIDGRWLEWEGNIGVAWIVIPDGRTSFSRWLRAENLGWLVRRVGTMVPARVEGQSLARAESYARAFARVLWLNGIDNRVETELT